MPKIKKDWDKENDLCDIELLKEGDWNTWNKYIAWLKECYSTNYGLYEEDREENITKAIWYCINKYNAKGPLTAYIIMKLNCLNIDSKRKEFNWQKRADLMRVIDDSEDPDIEYPEEIE